MHRRANQGYREIAAQLRRELLADWQPGRRLPTYADMCTRFATTPVTMQRAMDLLVEQGFVVTQPTVGSFCSELPPNRRQVGLVFPGHPGEIVGPGWSLNYLANLTVAQQLNAHEARWRIRFYVDVDEQGGKRGLKRLLQDIEDDVLAGLIWNYSPHELKHHPLIQSPPVPMVHYNPDFCREAPGLRLRSLPGNSFLERGLAWAADLGLHDVAMLTTPECRPDEIAEAFARHGMSFRPEWVLALNTYKPAWVAHALAAFFREDGRRRPETLIITDDHLVEPAAMALLALAPRELERLPVFAHWNFPLPYRQALPITRCGYDAEAWMRAALELIEASLEGAPTPSTTRTVPYRQEHGSGQTAGNPPAIDQIITQARELLQCLNA